MNCIFNQNGNCARLNMPTEKDCKCPLYMSHYEVCAFCGQPILEGGVYDTVSNLLFCNNCGHKLNTCATCMTARDCLFETDPSPVPKMVQQTVRQGNMVSTVPVKNPNRIEITCKKGCRCFDDEKGCLREFSTCQNWCLKEE